MNIVYNQNPLRTQVLLDEHEKKEFWYKIKVEELQETIISAYFGLDEDKTYFNIDEARTELDPEYFCPDWTDSAKKGEKSKLDQRVDKLFQYYIADLEQNPHCGDCTCVPCSCSKCRAEDILGIDTIAGLGKHEGHKIWSVFWRGHNQPDRTLDEVLEIIDKPYSPCKGPAWNGVSNEEFERHIPRWKTEHENAVIWLKTYRDKHFRG